MTIKQQGGIFGRNPTFNDVTVDGSLSVAGGTSITGDTDVTGTATSKYLDVFSGVLSEEYQARIGFSDQFHWTLGRENATTGDFYIKSVSAGTPTEIARFASTGLKFPNGKGIDFSATSGTGTSELFDDYEEGTWTPVVFGSSTAGTYELSANTSCTYVKIGGLVTIIARIFMDGSITAGGSGNVRISGLPYTMPASIYGSSFLANTSGIAFTGSFLAVERITSGATSTLYPYGVDNAGTATQVPIANVSASDVLSFQFSYRV